MASIVDRGKTRPKRWQVRYRTPDGPQRSRSFATLDEAKAFMSTIDVEVRAGTYVDPHHGRVTFGAFAAQVVPTLERPMRPTSRYRMTVALRNQILPRWEHVPLAAIAHTGIQQWINDLSDADLAPPTVLKAWQVFRKIITAAIDARLLAREPWGRMQLPKLEHHEARFLEPDEIDRLADAMGDHRSFVYLGAVCGLRAGELFALRWSAIDFDRATVEVRESVTDAGGLQHVGPPKTRASRRRVPMPAPVVDELELHRLTTPDPDGLVFPAQKGRHWRANNFRRRVWEPACERAGLDGLVIHELRHSAVAGWIEAGAEPVEIAYRAGHRSTVTILDRYGHRFPSQAQRVNDNIERMFREARAARGDQ